MQKGGKGDVFLPGFQFQGGHDQGQAFHIQPGIVHEQGNLVACGVDDVGIVLKDVTVDFIL